MAEPVFVEFALADEAPAAAVFVAGPAVAGVDPFANGAVALPAGGVAEPAGAGALPFANGAVALPAGGVAELAGAGALPFATGAVALPAGGVAELAGAGALPFATGAVALPAGGVAEPGSAITALEIEKLRIVLSMITLNVRIKCLYSPDFVLSLVVRAQ